MSFDLRVLRNFVRIAELGSLSRAARTLNVAQPALSQQVAGLEQHFKVRLFERSRKGVMLTGAGERLLAGASELLAKAQVLEENVSGTGIVSGKFNLGITGSAAMTLTAPLAMRLIQKHPALRLRIEEEKSKTLLEGLVAGRLDLIVSGLPGEGARIHSTPLAHETLYLVGRRDSELAETVDYADLGQYPLVQIGRTDESKCGRDAALRGMRADHARVVMETNSIAAMRTIVAENDLFTILPWSTVQDEVALGRLRASRIVNPEFHRPLFISWTSDRGYSNLVPVISAEIEALAEALVAQEIWR